jgi:hypothetical protein
MHVLDFLLIMQKNTSALESVCFFKILTSNSAIVKIESLSFTLLGDNHV